MRKVLMVSLLAAAGMAATGLAGAVSAREQIPAEERWWPYSAEIPGCDDPAVINKIRSRFAEKEATYWQSSLEIVAVDQIRTTAFRPNGLDLIPRRYCVARASLSNQRTSPLYYSVIEGGGMAGYGYGVHFCVAAYDRNRASAPECKIAKP